MVSLRSSQKLRQSQLRWPCFDEAIADGTAALPATEFAWHPTRQPVLLDEWTPSEERFGYTTIMNWTSYKDIEHDGTLYGQKDSEFEKFLDLPKALEDVSFQIALNQGKTRRSPKSTLTEHGWSVLEPNTVCPNFDTYRAFISASRAEWSVAKGGYVTGPSGWFSCRSACYLAAGRPVVVQSTGFERYVPVGEGVLSFEDPDGARDAIKLVETDYQAHSEAARHVAETRFASDHVLSAMPEHCDAAA